MTGNLFMRISRLPLLAAALLVINAEAAGQIKPPAAFSVPWLPGAPVYKTSGAFTDHLNITNNEGGPFENIYNGIDGSPFFFDNYYPAIIILSKGRIYQNIQTKLNLHTHDVIIIDSTHHEMVAADNLIVYISFTGIDGDSSRRYNFRSNYPEIDKNSSKDFYQVLSAGKIHLLKMIKKEVVEEKNIQSGEIKKEFKTREEYYVFSNGKMEKLKKDKDFILGFMSDRPEEIDEFLKTNKINFKNITSLTSLFEYYNSLNSDKAF